MAAISFNNREIKPGDILFGCISGGHSTGLRPIFVKVAYITPKGGFKGMMVSLADDTDGNSPSVWGLKQFNNPDNFVHMDTADIHESVFAAFTEYETKITTI